MQSNTISELFYATVSSVLPVALSQEIEANPPYGVYEIVENPIRTKRGVYKYTANVTLYIVALSFDEVEQLANAILVALSASQNNKYTVVLNTRSPSITDDDLWINKLDLTIQLYI